MNIRWLWGNYIEPEWKLSRQDVRTVHRLVKEQYIRSSRLVAVTLLWLLIIFGSLGLLQQHIAGMLAGIGMGTLTSWSLSKALIIAPLMMLALWSFRMIYTRPVRRAMRDLGYDVCINCGYWLRGLGEGTMRCPECGADRERSASGE
jgi:hypothetical protein